MQFIPFPNSSQAIAYGIKADHILYCGTRGPGKTAVQLGRFKRRVGVGYGEFWRGIIFDREFKNLADLVAQSKRFFKDTGGRFLHSASEYKWVWPTGEELLFRHVKKLEDYDDYHGHEYPFIGWNELTKHPTLELYDKMMSTNRSSFDPERDTPRKVVEMATGNVVRYDTPDGKPLPPIPLEVFSTCNPSGPGHNAVKRRFITPAPYGQYIYRETEIFNPKTQREEIYRVSQVALFGSYRENIYLDPKYVAELNNITDPNLKAAWLLGSWDVNAGGALDDLWRKDVHVIPRFPVPPQWRIDRSFDWGSSHPFSVGWWAEANGEEITLPDGRVWAPMRGSLIQCGEWYGTNEIGTNKGLKLSAKAIADGIIAREIEWMSKGHFKAQPWPGPADNQIRDVRESDVETIADKMSKEGIRWTRSDKSPGSRVIGLQLIRDRLEASVKGERPGIYWMDNCPASIDILPSLPRDDVKIDDIDTTSEDHPYDMVRYRVLKSANRTAQSIELDYAS